MNLSELSIRRPVFAWMLMSALIIFGGIAFMRMGISQLPDVDFPMVTVSASLDGAAPEVMEVTVVDVIEDALMSLEGIQSISSSAKSGSASVSVEFELGRDINQAMQDVQNKLSQVTRSLPRDMDPPSVGKMNPEDQPILWLTLRGESLPQRELMIYVRNILKDRFSTVAGVSDVFLGGYVEPNLRIWVKDEKLKAHALTLNDITQAIKSEHAEIPGGKIQSKDKEFNVRTLGEANSVEEFGNIIINTRGGRPNFQPLRIGDVADVEAGLADVRRLSRSQGKTAIGIGIRKQRGVNAVAVAHAVKERMELVKKTLPKGMELDVIFDSTVFIEESVGELNFTLILSAILTSLVCMAFLGSWSSTINVLMAIPTSIIGSFIVLSFAGFTLNTFTLLALSLAIGIVVDDAIMVLENIVRHREMGKTKKQAALDGSKEISFAAMAATISIIAIFLPVAFMKGAIGKFFFQFGVTMTVAVLLSLIEALTLTPMRCAQFVEGGKDHAQYRFTRWIDAKLGIFSTWYISTLGKLLNHRWKVIIISTIFFIFSMLSVFFINKEFVPAEDQSRFMVRLTAPVGSSLAFTDEKVKEVENYLAKRQEISKYFLSVGGFGGGDVNSAVIFVTMNPKGKRGKENKTQADFMIFTRKELAKIKDLKVVIQDLSMRGFTSSRGFPIEFNIRGKDFSELAKYSKLIIEEMEKSGKVTDVDTDYQLGATELQIIPDRQRTAARGVALLDIGQTVGAAVDGVILGKYSEGGRRYDIRLRLAEKEKNSPEKLKELSIRNNEGSLGQLGSVVNMKEEPALPSINRKERERTVSIFANIKKGESQAQILKDTEALTNKILPEGYRAVFGGSAAAFKEAFGSLIFAMILGFIVAYMILAAQFNSFIDPITVLLALPFSLSGAFLALLVTGLSLNIYSFIGLILLMGIVKKNSILIVDFTNQVRRHEKLSVHNAILKACPLRLRPIIMTSVATIAGAIPPALAIGPGAESRIPMAVCIIGGVLLSTILTIFVVPVAYSLFTAISEKVDPVQEE